MGGAQSGPAGASAPIDLHYAIRHSVVKALGTNRRRGDAKGDAGELLDSVMAAVDKEDDGMLNKAAFMKGSVLLGVDATGSELDAVFEALDSQGTGRVPVARIYAFASSHGQQRRVHLQRGQIGSSRSLTGRRKSSVLAAPPRAEPASGGSAASKPRCLPRVALGELCGGGGAGACEGEPEAWRATLREFDDHVSQKRRQRLRTAEEKHFARWEEKSEAWEAKLARAEERRAQLHKGLFPPRFASRPAGGAGSGAAARRFAGGASRRSRNNARRSQYLESVAKDSTLLELQDITHFTVGDLESLRERFFEQAMSTALTVDKFCAFLTREYPQLSGHQSLLLRLFTLFDTDGNGTVSFQEFIIGLTKTLKCSVEEKIHLMFSCIDLSSDGRINLQEFTHVISQSQGDMQASISYSRDFFSYLDRDNNGTISLDEFKKALQGNPKLFKSLMRALPLPTTAFDVMEELQVSAHPGGGNGPVFNLESLKGLYREYATMHRRSRRRQAMSRKEFRRIMGKHFGLTRLDQQKQLDRLFDTFDTDGSDSVSFEEILRGLSLLINQQSQSEEESEDCLDFYFDLFDADNSGNVQDADIKGLLAASENQLRSGMKETQDILQALEKRSSGQALTQEEFLSLSETYPQLLQILRANLR